MSPTDFFNLLKPYAIADMKETGVPASLTLAQAALESNWGKSKLATESKNLFGIKNKRGKNYKTKEFIRGNWYTVNAPFAVYQDWTGSIADHSALVLRGTRDKPKRYHGVLWEKDYKKACDAIQAGGYATDPTYSKKLQLIIESNNLQAIDEMVFDEIERISKEVMPMLEKWQEQIGKEAIDFLTKEGLINNPESHKQNLDAPVPKWLFFILIARAVGKK